MKKRGCSLLLAVILLFLTGCSASPADLPKDIPAETLAYVPLDDRPDNVERAVYLAESLGYEVSMPLPDDYQTRLSGQPKNENGTQYGDRGDLYTWVVEQEKAGCDRYILSMDQMLSGGLVNSRSMANGLPVKLPDGTVLTEPLLLETILTTLAADENNQVWLLESVMRLAPTVGYDHWDVDGYNALRSYGMEPRPALSGELLTADHICQDYRLAPDGTLLDPAAFSLTETDVEEYLSARTRKLNFSTEMQEILHQPGYENFHLLVGVDDSSVEDSIQKNEIALLRSGLRPEKDALLSGVDDLAFKAISKLYLEKCEWKGASACVRYFGGTEQSAACDYDYQPLTRIMEEHLGFFDLAPVENPEQADLQVLVLTQPQDEEKKEEYCQALTDALQENRKNHRPTVLIDAGNGKYGDLLQTLLTEKAELGWLLSYSGFLDMAIVTGTALSHGVARYAFLQQEQLSADTEIAFLRTLADSIVKDFCYKHAVREGLIQYIRKDLHGSPDNFYTPELDQPKVLARLETEMQECAEPVLKNLEHSRLIVALAPYRELGWGTLKLGGYRFPWNRAFEIGMDLTMGPIVK